MEEIMEKPKVWTDSDIKFLRLNNSLLPDKELCEKLNKTEKQLWNIRSRLKLVKPKTAIVKYRQEKKKKELSWDDQQRIAEETSFKTLCNMVMVNLKFHKNEPIPLIEHVLKINPEYSTEDFNKLLTHYNRKL